MIDPAEDHGFTKVWQEDGGYIRLPLSAYEPLLALLRPGYAPSLWWEGVGLYGERAAIRLDTITVIEEVTADMVRQRRELETEERPWE